jgi:hypothetical protein
MMLEKNNFYRVILINAEIAKKFNVSTTAMGFRIQNLGYSWL